jgi:hypothetical protein
MPGRWERWRSANWRLRADAQPSGGGLSQRNRLRSDRGSTISVGRIVKATGTGLSGASFCPLS